MNREIHVRFWEGLGVRFPPGYSLGTPHAELDVFCGRAEVVVRTEQDQIVFAAELNEYRVDGSDLYAMATAQIPSLRCFDMVFSVWLYESKRGKPFYQLAPCFWPSKALK